MLIANKLIPGARGLAGVLLKRAARMELGWDIRQKSRFDATDSAGRQVGVFLPRGSVLRGGDALVAEDGSLIIVQAAAQPVLVVRHCAAHGSAFDLMRAAYHLGNRHVALDLRPDRLLLEPDHVLAEMLRAMHLIVTEELAAFEPESGAYAAGGGHHHGSAQPPDHPHEQGHAPEHAPAHDHQHAHAPEHAHQHANDPAHAHEHTTVAAPVRGKPVAVAVQAAPTPHVHGPGCGHGHGRHGH